MYLGNIFNNQRNLSLSIISYFQIQGVTIDADTQTGVEKDEEEKDNKENEDVVEQENGDNTVDEK